MPPNPKAGQDSMDIHTARINYQGADRLDITRKSGGPIGIVLAPSWEILAPVLNARRQKTMGNSEWERYKRAYIDEMRTSYQTWPQHWERILARPEVTLVCYCADFLRCHRSLAADLLVKASKGAAFYRGERKPAQQGLFG